MNCANTSILSGAMLLRASVILALATLTACSNDMSDLESYAAEIRARKSDKIEPIPEITPYTAYIYEEAGRRDPFSALKFATALQTNTEGIKPDFDRRKEYLEEFPLDSLTMVGTITSEQTLFAMVRDGDGVVHRVTLGNYMGQNFGRITGIAESEVSLIEIIPDGFGGYMEQDATLAMSE